MLYMVYEAEGMHRYKDGGPKYKEKRGCSRTRREKNNIFSILEPNKKNISKEKN